MLIYYENADGELLTVEEARRLSEKLYGDTNVEAHFRRIIQLLEW